MQGGPYAGSYKLGEDEVDWNGLKSTKNPWKDCIILSWQWPGPNHSMDSLELKDWFMKCLSILQSEYLLKLSKEGKPAQS